MKDKKEESYKFVIIGLCAVIVVCVLTIAFLVFVAMPNVVYKVSKQALNEVYDERIEAAK